MIVSTNSKRGLSYLYLAVCLHLKLDILVLVSSTFYFFGIKALKLGPVMTDKRPLLVMGSVLEKSSN
jgi:hypothetical protein